MSRPACLSPPPRKKKAARPARPRFTHELTAETNPLGYQQTFSYDAAGEQTGQTDYNGHQISYSYNLAGWQTGETWLNSLNQAIYQATYSYNNAGQLTGASDPNSAYSYNYDSAGRMTQEVVTYPGLSANPLVTLTYGYDGFGRRTSLTDSLGGQLTYSYNGNSQLTGMTMYLSGTQEAQLSFSYNSQDLLSGISRTAGIGSQSYDTVTSSYSYDGANRLTGITYTYVPTSTQLASFTYSYNADSQVTSYTGPEGTLNYTYDKIGELTGVSGAEQATYSYGSNGNRTMAGYQTGTGNELTNDGTYTYTYDKNGNVLTKTDSAGDVWNYTWDYRNRLTEVKETNSSQQVVLDETFQYDVNNNLIGETVGGVQQRWTVYDGGTPYMDLTATGQVSERYITDPTGLDTFWARVGATGVADWYVTDALGSVRALVGATGTVEDQLNYDAYGKTLSETNPSSGDRFKYAGGQYDSGLGMYNFDARWYTPANGGWNSPDPLGLRPDTNPYRYVFNSPTNGTDPSGEAPFSYLGWTWEYDNGNLWIEIHQNDETRWVQVLDPSEYQIPVGTLQEPAPFQFSHWLEIRSDSGSWRTTYLLLSRLWWPQPPGTPQGTSGPQIAPPMVLLPAGRPPFSYQPPYQRWFIGGSGGFAYPSRRGIEGFAPSTGGNEGRATLWIGRQYGGVPPLGRQIRPWTQRILRPLGIFRGGPRSR
jgi:RHS repeat-associated protein